MKHSIKILGTGCPKCKNLERMTRDVVQEYHFDADIEKEEDIVKIMGYGVMSTPALVVNEKVVMNGRLPTRDEIKKLIEKEING